MDLSMASPNSPQALVELIRRLQAEINTTIPGQIIAFDTVTQTATVQPCIRGTRINELGEKSNFDLPQILKCPVVFPYSTTTGFAVTFPVQAGDQCLILFSQRSFDNWLEYGSIQSTSEKDFPRLHDYSDAICLMGMIPKPNAIADFNNNGVELRNKTRTAKVTVSDTGVEINAIAETKITALKTSLIGTVFTGATPENTQQGLTRNVTIGALTMVFVNGLLVDVH